MPALCPGWLYVDRVSVIPLTDPNPVCDLEQGVRRYHTYWLDILTVHGTSPADTYLGDHWLSLAMPPTWASHRDILSCYFICAIGRLLYVTLTANMPLVRKKALQDPGNPLHLHLAPEGTLHQRCPAGAQPQCSLPTTRTVHLPAHEHAFTFSAQGHNLSLGPTETPGLDDVPTSSPGQYILTHMYSPSFTLPIALERVDMCH